MTEELIEESGNTFKYNRALNHSFDYIPVSAMMASTLLWSIAILRPKNPPVWIGILEILLVLAALLCPASIFWM